MLWCQGGEVWGDRGLGWPTSVQFMPSETRFGQGLCKETSNCAPHKRGCLCGAGLKINHEYDSKWQDNKIWSVSKEDIPRVSLHYQTSAFYWTWFMYWNTVSRKKEMDSPTRRPQYNSCVIQFDLSLALLLVCGVTPFEKLLPAPQQRLTFFALSLSN
jgi:hypothetical protein